MIHILKLCTVFVALAAAQAFAADNTAIEFMCVSACQCEAEVNSRGMFAVPPTPGCPLQRVKGEDGKITVMLPDGTTSVFESKKRPKRPKNPSCNDVRKVCAAVGMWYGRCQHSEHGSAPEFQCSIDGVEWFVEANSSPSH